MSVTQRGWSVARDRLVTTVGDDGLQRAASLQVLAHGGARQPPGALHTLDRDNDRHQQDDQDGHGHQQLHQGKGGSGAAWRDDWGTEEHQERGG